MFLFIHMIITQNLINQKMKNRFTSLLLLLVVAISAQAQLVSYTLQQSFTKSQLDSFLATTGFALPVTPQYDIDVYKVIYKTPYKNIDSLVNVSGIVVIPQNTPCPSALGCYAHGTFSRRVEVPSLQGAERPIGFFFAGIGGVVTAMPDELGLGDSDTSVIIHPYVNYFHSGYAAVNIMRAARELCTTLSKPLSGEVVLTGYSQGGYTTMAINKMIQENFSSEFNIKASSPMSGPYDLKKTMVDVMLSNDTFSSPSYLPYLLLGHHSVSPLLQQRYPTPSHIFKSPYDTLIPPLFYSKIRSTGYIDQFCNPVPRRMILDSVITAFENDTLHPFRVVLAENDLMGWTPQNSVFIHYCTLDEQVTYLNAVRADTAWRRNGAPDIQIQNHGPRTHGGCVQPALTSTVVFLLSKLSVCNSILESEPFLFSLYPNPANDILSLQSEIENAQISLFDINGKIVFSKIMTTNSEELDVKKLERGLYIIELKNDVGQSAKKKFVRF
jgi:hypothetical protein